MIQEKRMLNIQTNFTPSALTLQKNDCPPKESDSEYALICMFSLLEVLRKTIFQVSVLSFVLHIFPFKMQVIKSWMLSFLATEVSSPS